MRIPERLRFDWLQATVRSAFIESVDLTVLHRLAAASDGRRSFAESTGRTRPQKPERLDRIDIQDSPTGRACEATFDAVAQSHHKHRETGSAMFENAATQGRLVFPSRRDFPLQS